MESFIPFEPKHVLKGKLLLLMFVIFFFLESAGSLTLLLSTYVFTLYFSTAKLYKTLFYADIVYLDHSSVNLFHKVPDGKYFNFCGPYGLSQLLSSTVVTPRQALIICK